MKMLVTKLSKGKYANEGQLFAEPISDDNVKLMGEMIALQALRNVMPYDFEVVSKLYNGLVKDLNRISQIDYTITDGYDYGKDSKGHFISIKTACYRAVDKELLHFRRKIAHNRQIDFGHNRKDIPDPRDCFADKDEDYAKADALIEKLHLTEPEIETLNCYMSGMKQSEAAAALGITIFGVKYRKLRIRQKYHAYKKTLLTT